MIEKNIPYIFISVIQLHREFLRAGSDVLQSFTFLQATDELLRSYGIDATGAEINDAGVRLVKQVAAEGDALTGGGIARTGALYRDASNMKISDISGEKLTCTTFNRKGRDKAKVQQEFRKQAKIFVDGGMDFIICEVT